MPKILIKYKNFSLTMEYVSTFTSTTVFLLLYKVLISPLKISSFFKPVAVNPCTCSLMIYLIR
jgi:hypothetical protein